MFKFMALGSLLLLCFWEKAQGVTPAKTKSPLPRAPIDQMIPQDTKKAGQELELRKVQALLSGQRSKSPLQIEPRS